MNAPLHDQVDACVFDAYGTLFDVNAATERCRADIGEATDELSALWRAKQLEYTWLRSLMGRFDDFWQVTGDSLDYAMGSLGIDNPVLRSRLMELYLELDPYPEVVETLGRLKEAGLKTAILSNGTPTMLVSAVKRAGLYDVFGGAMFSVNTTQIYKPHPSVYQMAVDGLKAEPDRICFLSSNAWDVAGAAAFGFRVVWINRLGRRAEELPGRAEHEIVSLDRLPPLLGL